MSGSLDVHLNRGELHAVEPATDSFATAGSFDVQLVNSGRAVHVHLKLAGRLAEVAEVEETNLFVDTEGTESVQVRVDAAALPVEGELTVVTGYGRQRAAVDVRVTDPVADRSVAVDESLSKPPERSGDDQSLPGVLTREGTLRVGGLGLLAVLLGWLAISQAASPVVVMGVLAVFVGVGVATYLLAR